MITFSFPEHGLKSSKGLFCFWRAAHLSGGVWRDARPPRAPSLLLLSRDSDLRSHWSIRCPPEYSFMTAPADKIPPREYFIPERMKLTTVDFLWKGRMFACGANDQRLTLTHIWYSQSHENQISTVFFSSLSSSFLTTR